MMLSPFSMFSPFGFGGYGMGMGGMGYSPLMLMPRLITMMATAVIAVLAINALKNMFTEMGKAGAGARRCVVSPYQNSCLVCHRSLPFTSPYHNSAQLLASPLVVCVGSFDGTEAAGGAARSSQAPAGGGYSYDEESMSVCRIQVRGGRREHT
jgi:hypothetical protein